MEILDLSSCRGIESLDVRVFTGMPFLTHLYLINCDLFSPVEEFDVEFYNLLQKDLSKHNENMSKLPAMKKPIRPIVPDASCNYLKDWIARFPNDIATSHAYNRNINPYFHSLVSSIMPLHNDNIVPLYHTFF